MKAKKKKDKKLTQKYKEMKAKGNVGNTLAKTGIDLILGATLGAGVGAATGRMAIPLGLLMIAGSHYFEEETGVIRTTGSAAIAYGIAKAIANENLAKTEAVNGFTLAGEANKAKTRLESFKDELFTAFFINKILKSKNQDGQTTDEGVGAISLSDLDFIERELEKQAAQYDSGSNDYLPSYDEMAANLEMEQPEYSNDLSDPDLTNI